MSKKYNLKINKLFLADQKDRKKKNINWDIIGKKDIERLKKLNQIIKNNKNLSPEDYYMIAMLYQHGVKLSDIQKAKYYAYKSMKLGYEKAKWLYAAATDRFLMYKGKKQKYGTQFKINKKGKWIFYPVNKNTTDKERFRYNVLPLKESKRLAVKLNKKD